MTTDNTTSVSAIAVRVYATSTPPTASKRRSRREPSQPAKLERLDTRQPSAWTLTLDTETLTDVSQQLRFGVYQVRHNTTMVEQGAFYDPPTLSASEQSLLYAYAAKHGWQYVYTVREWCDKVFYYYSYDRHATVIGFNLPFDISRLALGHATARGSMRGGFSCTLSENSYRPRVRVKAQDSHKAFINFAAPSRPRLPFNGYFVDVKTLADALLSSSWSLDRLARHLDTPTTKLTPTADGEFYDRPLTVEFLDYAVADVQATYECYQKLRRIYNSYRLPKRLDEIYSEASLGKAYLEAMNVQPLLVVQPDFDKKILGAIMNGYYGGRSEVHIRRKVVRVQYVDFQSMYPTVCTLMHLWHFVTAQGVRTVDATQEVQALLSQTVATDWQQQERWQTLTCIVQVLPDDDILPARAEYNGDTDTIGVNYLTSTQPLWYTLADCIASTLLTGKPPKVIQALRFEALEQQHQLRSIAIFGNRDYTVDPAHDDFFRRCIDLRLDLKAQLRQATDSLERTRLDAEQLAAKIMANATSYGIYVELNPETATKTHECTVYSAGELFTTQVHTNEKPGKYYHPLLATLVTGAARLMLALMEVQAHEHGIDWCFTDTDSMALARPDGMADADFLNRADAVRAWFNDLNPYEHQVDIAKLEDVNKPDRDKTGTIIASTDTPLYAYAISDKRYALFHIDPQGKPVLRDFKVHGLGYLLNPGDDTQVWYHDLWYRIVEAALAGHPDTVDLTGLPYMDMPAVRRYNATTPHILRWFDRYNAGKPYREQVRPFGFMLAYTSDIYTETFDPTTGKRKWCKPKPVAPYHVPVSAASAYAFDRETGKPVPQKYLRTYQTALAGYHNSRETKFLNGDHYDTGETRRRHVVVDAIVYIGKEATFADRRTALGSEPDDQTEYGRVAVTPATLSATEYDAFQALLDRDGVTAVARKMSVSPGHLYNIQSNRRRVTPKTATAVRAILYGETE